MAQIAQPRLLLSVLPAQSPPAAAPVSSSVCRTVMPFVSIGSPSKGELSRIKVSGVNREQVEDAVKRDGHQRNLRPDRQVRSAGQKRLAVRRSASAALRKNKQRHPRTQGPHPHAQARHRGVGIGRIDGNLARTIRYHPINAIGHNSFLARMRNWKGIAANMTGVSMYEVWFDA